jgi:hypothetical protein
MTYYLLGALVCLAATIYVYREDLAHFVGASSVEQEAEARASAQMNARLADQKTVD